MGYPREYRACILVRTNVYLEWMVLDIHVFLIKFYNLRNSFHFQNDTSLSCPPKFTSQSTKKKKKSINDWLNEGMFECSTHTTKDLLLWDCNAPLKHLTVPSVKMMPHLRLVWEEENKVKISEKQTNENASNKKHKIQKFRHATIKPKTEVSRLFFTYLHVMGQKSNKLQRSLLPQSQTITSTVAVNWKVSISSLCLSWNNPKLPVVAGCAQNLSAPPASPPQSCAYRAPLPHTAAASPTCLLH